MQNYSEDTLVEQPTIALFERLGYETVNAFHEQAGAHSVLGRETFHEVVLVASLREALRRLTAGVSGEAIELAIEELTRDRSALSPVHANREVYRLLKYGVKVKMRVEGGWGDEGDEGGGEIDEVVQVIDWKRAERNEFLLVSQFKVAGEMYNRRADLVGFINGLPLVLVELKASHRRLENAFHDNLRDYKDTIPQLFWYNAFIILSNGRESRIGSITAGWEHFFEWKKINDDGERGVVSLETMVRGVCEGSRLLDIVENFTLFSDAGGALVKLIAKNHQYLGVNNALAAVRSLNENRGRLGVFWHTQGSGKSYSMVFFSQKVLRKIPGNWTFLIVTDRLELDEQIYKTFAGVGAVTEVEVQAESGDTRATARNGERCKGASPTWRRRIWRWSSRSRRMRSTISAGRDWISRRTAGACCAKTWRRASRTRMIRCASSSSARCGLPASTCRASRRCTSTSLCATTR